VTAASSTAQTRKPLVGRPFPKGVSGNPSGQPKGVREVREAAREHTALAMQTLAEACRSKRAPWSARVAAAEALLSRGWGKPSQPVEINDNRPLAGVSAEVLVAAVARLRIEGG
jgi:hypothetical protein